MTNMTKTEIPFGELDDETAAALFLAWRADKPVEILATNGNWAFWASGHLCVGATYRLRPGTCDWRDSLVQRPKTEGDADAIEALQAEIAEARDKARINGDFDDPDLMRFGPLTESQTEKQIRADERERIAKALDAEADVIPCQEDAMITRSCARLVRTNFSYDDADRLADQQST